VTYLRISITDRCNLHCRYCAPFRAPPLPRQQLLTLEELVRLVRIGIGIGISKVRLTGGEPLLRRGVVDLVQRLRHLPGLQDLALTTNGTRLPELAPRLRSAGLKRINISLDTLDRDRFQRLTGVDGFVDAWAGVMAAIDCGFDPVKINTVVMKGVNDDELEGIAALALRFPVHVRFIEYMPIGTEPLDAQRYFFPIDEVERRLRRLGELVPIAPRPGDGPARRLRPAGAAGEIGLIGSMSSHFCRTCNRLRLTAAGRLRPCLLADGELDVITTLRRGASDQEIAALFRQALAGKAAEHQLSFRGGQTLHTRMVSIGG
jgi:cyclic pyranopterin phosphate synthase